MRPGKQRFEYYLQQAESLMQQASASVNPAAWLYQNNGRTCFFMLEGLCRLYKSLHNPKKFGKILDHVKLIEDGIGAIDYYDHIAIDLKKIPGIPDFVLGYVEAQTREKTQRLNEVLRENGWLGKSGERFAKIREKLDEADWMKAEKETEAIRRFYDQEIRELIKEMPETFTEMELHVHEIRRDLRWLSIYPQALNGLIQLHIQDEVVPHTEKYLTASVLESPYNRLPEAGDNPFILYLQQKRFLSLSWVIAEIGAIKDEGLAVMAIAEALEQTVRMTHENAVKEALRLLGKEDNLIRNLLNKASSICHDFIQEGHLNQLIYGVYPRQK